MIMSQLDNVSRTVTLHFIVKDKNEFATKLLKFGNTLAMLGWIVL